MQLNLHIVSFTKDFLMCLLTTPSPFRRPTLYTIIFSMCVFDFDRLEGICCAYFEAGIGPCVFSVLFQRGGFWLPSRQILLLLLQPASGRKKGTMGSWLLLVLLPAAFILWIVSWRWKRIVRWRCFCKWGLAHVHIPCLLTWPKLLKHGAR